MELILFELGPVAFTFAHLFILLGGALIIMEAFIPEGHLVVFGVGLLAAGIVGMLVDFGMSFPVYILFLSLTALAVGILAFLGYRKVAKMYGTEKLTTSDSSDLMDKQGVVTKKVTPDSGEVRIRGVGSNPRYQARCEIGEISEESKIKVVDPRGGSLLMVEEINGE
ncbi:MAG: NfeD family protein [bacterium]